MTAGGAPAGGGGRGQTQPTRVLSEQARVILEIERAENPGASLKSAIVKLFGVMTPLVGAHAFTALVHRAVHLTNRVDACFAEPDLRDAPSFDVTKLGETSITSHTGLRPVPNACSRR